MRLITKYAVLIGVVIATLLMTVAILLYPGGTMFNEYSEGFDWKKNFVSNLFGSRALNGEGNPSQIWAYAAMVLLPGSYALFFFKMSKKIPEKTMAGILKYGGIANLVFTFLTVTYLHDLMLIISTSIFWSCLFIITIFVLRSKLQLFKLACVFTMMLFYYSTYLWGVSDWNLLPIMQKVNFVSSTLLILGLEYFTTKEDFAHIQSKRVKFVADN